MEVGNEIFTAGKSKRKIAQKMKAITTVAKINISFNFSIQVFRSNMSGIFHRIIRLRKKKSNFSRDFSKLSVKSEKFLLPIYVAK